MERAREREAGKFKSPCGAGNNLAENKAGRPPREAAAAAAKQITATSKAGRRKKDDISAEAAVDPPPLSTPQRRLESGNQSDVSDADDAVWTGVSGL